MTKNEAKFDERKVGLSEIERSYCKFSNSFKLPSMAKIFNFSIDLIDGYSEYSSFFGNW